MNLEVHCSASAVYFLASEGRRRGRPRKNPAAYPPPRFLCSTAHMFTDRE